MNDQTVAPIEPSETTSLKTESYLHFNPERIDFALSEYEFDQLIEGGFGKYKDFCLVCIGLGVPCAINAFIETRKVNYASSLEFTINFVVATVTLLIGAFSAFQWYRDSKRRKTLERKVRDKPKVKLG